MTKNNTFKRYAAHGLVLSSVLGGTVITSGMMAPDAQAAEGAFQCSPVHIISVQGTGGSFVGKGTELTNFADGALATSMINKFGTEKVTGWSTPYPASAGGVYSAAHPQGQTQTYGQSRLFGDRASIKHMEEYKSQCGNTKFLIVGYSQGADVAGDVAALIAHGASKTVNNDDIMGAVLYSDPGRSGNSKYTGVSGERKAYIPLPDGAQYQRNGEFSNPTQREDTVGWTGQRSLDFKGLEGKIISLCNPMDLACSVDKDSVLRKVADLSDKNFRATPSSYDNNMGIKKMVDNGRISGVFLNALDQGFLQDILAGDVTKAISKLDNIVKTDKSLSQDERDTLNNAMTEIKYIWGLMKSDKGYGSTPSEKDILTHAIQNGGPQLLKVIPENLLNPQVNAALQTVLSAYGRGTITTIDDATQKRMAYELQYIGKFPSEHGKYFGNASVPVNGVAADAWADGAVAKGIENVVNNTPYTVNMGGNTRGENEAVEIAEPNRLPDGLQWVLDPNWNGDAGLLNPDGTPKDGIMWDNTPGDSDDDVVTPTSKPTVPSSSTPSRPSSDDSSSSSSSTRTNNSSANAVNGSGSSLEGPQVNTGGHVEHKSFWDKVKAVFA